MKLTVSFLVGLLLTPVFVLAQNPSPDANKTVEDVYLQTSVEVQMVKSLVSEPNRGDKLKALEYLQKMYDNNKINEKSTEVIDLLGELGGEGVTKEVRQNGRLINDFPDVRRQSAELLGKLPGDKARDLLINMALKDPEPMVAAEAVYSLGLVGGGDDPSRVESIIASLVKSQDAVRPDSNFAFAAVSAFEKLAAKHKGKVNQEVFAALIRIQNGNYIRPVREKAKQVLDGFTKF